MHKKVDQDEIYVGLDIGTTKICAVVGRMTPQDKVEILGIGKADSKGVVRGVVANLDLTVESIIKAVEEAASEAEAEKITTVNVGIAGQHIKSMQQTMQYFRKDPLKPVSVEEIKHMKNEMMHMSITPGTKIISVLPQEYTIDGEKGIQFPVGHTGSEIIGHYHVITGGVTAISNINNCLTNAGLEASNMTLEPIASSEAVLLSEEKEAGVVLVDIGGGTTDIAIFYENSIRYSAVLPIGGKILTADIQEGCNVLKSQAEQLKIQFGNALARSARENEIITVPGIHGREAKEISKKNLAHIIQARMEELLEMIDNEIVTSGLKEKLSAGMVITGGGALLQNLKPLAEFKTGMTVKIGFPNVHLASESKKVNSPIFATAIGLIITDKQQRDSKTTINPAIGNQENASKEGSGIFGSLSNFIKSLFNEPEE